MPNYPWLAEAHIDGNDVKARMRALRLLGDPYSEEDLAGAPDAVRDKTELDALVAYLQGLGVAGTPPAPPPVAQAAVGSP
jgi:cytochrome c oxidase cbb3-type subunit 2